MTTTDKRTRSALGAELTLAELETDPHAALARLRDLEPVSWVPARLPAQKNRRAARRFRLRWHAGDGRRPFVQSAIMVTL